MKRTALAFGLVSVFTIATAVASCGSTTIATTTGTGGGGHTGTGSHTGGAGTGTATGGQGGQIIFMEAGPGCNDGDPCGDGGVCVSGTCCASGVGCGAACCNAGDVCNFQKCETPGAACVDATDCMTGFYCDYALGPQPPSSDGGADSGTCVSGAFVQTGKCLSLPPTCAPGQNPGDPITCLPKCQYKPASPDFSVVQKYYWGRQTTPPYSTDVMMAPIVINLDDDNCDGKVDQNDIPEIVFSTFTGGAYYKQGTLHAISIINGQVVDKWSVPNVTQPGGGLAAADLDGDGIPEIVGCMNPGPGGNSCCDATAQNTGVIAFRADGSTFWTQPDTTQVHCGYETPVIADLDQDGNPEVIVGFTILDGKTGAVKKNLDPAATYGVHIVGVSDLDGDGKLDITDGQRAYRSDGTLLWDLRPGGPAGANAIPGGYSGIGDFDGDGKPEVVVISSGGPHTLELVHYDPTQPGGAKVIRRGININTPGVTTAAFCGVMSEYGGGPPTVADFDGDGVPDVGMAGAVAYTVFSGVTLMNAAIPDAMVTPLWTNPTHDCSSAVTGSSVFDFTGSGKAQVIYSDERHLWMYDGPTGMNLIPSTCNTTGTLWEYPLVADVENIGQAEIVIASNAYAITCPDDGSKQSGIRVFGSASGSWVRTRDIWNEHSYHITNINDNGTVPKVELPNWAQPGFNNYRQNKQPGDVFAAPDAVVSIAAQCLGGLYTLVATVQNLGEAPLPAGVVVGFYEGAPGSGMKLGTGVTTQQLYPAASENVVLNIPNAPAVLTGGQTTVYAVVDDGMPMHTWHECNTTNDTSAAVSSKCTGAQ